VKELVDAGADINAADKDGSTPLRWAATRGLKNVVEVLVDEGADVIAADKDGWTVLRWAAQKRFKELVEMLLKAGALVDCSGRDRSALEAAVTEGAYDMVEVLVAWGATVPDGIRPSATRALRSAKAKRLRSILDETPCLTEQERENARAEWRAAVAEARSQVAVVSAADRALAELHGVLDGFVSESNALNVAALKRDLTTSRIKDVRCLRCAHHVLVYAEGLGIFVGEAAEKTKARRIHFSENVYEPVLGHLQEGDAHLVAAIIRDAAKHGLVEDYHQPDITTALHLHKVFYAELFLVHHRLNGLGDALTTTCRLVQGTMEELRGLQQHVHDKEQRDKKAAVAKTLVKLGLSLAPVVGGALNIGVDAVVAFAESATGAAVVYGYMANPTNFAAAREFLRCVQDAKGSMTPGQLTQLEGLLRPFPSLEELDKQLGYAVQVAGMDAGAGDEFVQEVSEVEDTGSAAEPADNAAEDVFGKPSDAMRDAAVEYVVDAVVDAQRPNATPHLAVDSAGDPDGPLGGHRPPDQLVGGAHAVAEAPVEPFGETFFAGAMSWDTDAVVSKLVDYVAVNYDTSKRAAFHKTVCNNATDHDVEGTSVVRCQCPDGMTACLLGDRVSRYGVAQSVRAFVVDVKRYAEAP